MSKIFLITGASAGIGKATAELLAKEPGARIILHGRNREKLEAVARGLKCETHLIVFDIQDRNAALTALDALPTEWREIDVLVNNAGLALGLEPADACDFTDWQTMIDTNILGLLTMTRAILPGMRARKRGHIVNIASTAGNYHYPGANVYGATKAFVTYFSLALRSDLLGSPVRVSNLEPGMVETDFSNVRFKGDAQRANEVYANVEPMQPGDIAEAVRWVLAQPPHVNINRIELMATAQAPAGLAVARGN